MASRLVLIFMAILATAVAQQYSDYDYQEQPAPRSIAQPAYSRPSAAQQPQRSAGPTTVKPQPIPILKQINRHNDDGSYTYGYEGADGSFKIETKTATGEVKGKYGYVDDTGKLRTVEYGANKYGFQPSGEGITVAPPTLVDETRLAKEDRAIDYDDGQYYEEQVPVRQSAPKTQRPKKTKVAPQQQQYFESNFQQQEPQQFQQPQQQPRQQFQQPQQQPRQQFQQPQQFQPRPAPAARVSYSQGPEPPRAQISGAVPVPSNDGAYRPQQPQQQRQIPVQPAPVHQFQQQPPQQPAYQLQQFQRPQQQVRSGGARGFFDQLMQDYALPQGGSSQPLHDISFGLNY